MENGVTSRKHPISGQLDTVHENIPERHARGTAFSGKKKLFFQLILLVPVLVLGVLLLSGKGSFLLDVGQNAGGVEEGVDKGWTAEEAVRKVIRELKLPEELIWQDVDTAAKIPFPITTFYAAHCLPFELPERRAIVMGLDTAEPYNMSEPKAQSNLEMLRLFHPLEDVIFFTQKETLEDFVALNEESIREFNLKPMGFEVPLLSASVRKAVDGSSESRDLEYLKVNLFGLDMYDAVIYLDKDMRVFGSLDAVFRCAAQDYFISTTGQGEAFNAGFFAFKPSKSLYDDITKVLQTARNDPKRGFDNTGFGHFDNIDRHPQKFFSGAGPQGFFWYYFYLRKEGNFPGRLTGAHMLRCEVNGMCDYLNGLRSTVKYSCLGYPNPPLTVQQYCSGLEYGDDAAFPYAFHACIRDLAHAAQTSLRESTPERHVDSVVAGIQHCNQKWAENKKATIAAVVKKEAMMLPRDTIRLLGSDRLNVTQKLQLLPINKKPADWTQRKDSM